MCLIASIRSPSYSGTLQSVRHLARLKTEGLYDTGRQRHGRLCETAQATRLFSALPPPCGFKYGTLVFYSRSVPMVGRTVHHYQFLEKLGAGGMGEIWKAQDTRLNRFVAVKVLTSASAGDPERRRRFIQEAQAASALNHPNIITIHDIISEGDAEFMVMEFV